MLAKKMLRITALAMALVFIFSVVALAATPSVIYYQNQQGTMVKADYQQALDLAVGGNPALLNALKEAYKEAQDNFRPILVKNDDGTVVNWQSALQARKSYQEAVNAPEFAATEPEPESELVVGENNQPIEKPVVKPISLSVSPPEVSLKVGETQQLEVTVAPADSRLEFASSNAEVATVNESGLVTAVAPGGATITVTASKEGCEQATASVAVTVAEPEWPAEMEGLPLIVPSELTGITYATITIKAEYVDLVTAVTIAGKAAVQQPDKSKWRAEVPAGTTAESLAGKIVITKTEPQPPAPVEAIKEVKAKVDMMGYTYVQVYLNEGIEASSVTANGVALQENTEQGRWEGIFDNLKAGDVVTIVVTTAGGQDVGTATVIPMGSQ